MIRVPWTFSYVGIFYEFSEDAHDTRIRVMAKDIDITEVCANDVLAEGKQEWMRYHSGMKYENPDHAYEYDRDQKDMLKNG